MKKYVLLLLLGIVGKVQAQVTLALQVPPAGVVQKSQLWNMVLVNGNNSNYEVEVSITLLSTIDNNPVLTATGRSVVLSKGAHQLKYTDFTPVNYKYLSPAFNVDLRPEGFLPVGSYTACYTVSRWVSDGFEPLTEDYLALEVQPLSPPVLNTPADKEILETNYPQFTWLPPAPVNLFSDLTYDVVITRVEAGQVPQSAIQQNIPAYNEGRSRTNFLNYPASFKSLDTGITYAWCVIARNNSQFVAQSDVWTFSISGKQLINARKEGASYIRLTREANAADAICEEEILIAYQNEAKDTTVHFVISPLGDNKEATQITGTLTLVPGQNFIRLPVAIVRQLTHQQRYRFELSNTRQEHWYSKFQYYKANR
jgi:hypothetical protein